MKRPGQLDELLDVALDRFGESRAGIRLLLQRDFAAVGELDNRR